MAGDAASEGDAPSPLRTALAVGGEGLERRVGESDDGVNEGGRDALPAVMTPAGGDAAVEGGKEALWPDLLPAVALLNGGKASAEGGQGLFALPAVALVTVVVVVVRPVAAAEALQRTLKQAALFGWDPALVAV